MPSTSGPRNALRPRRVAVTVVGSVLIAAGAAALVLPGPGLLLILAGLVVLSTEFEWAARRVDWMREKALGAAATGVETWPRIIFSAFSALVVMAVGVFWGLDPQIPQIWLVGPDLPFGGWGTGAAIFVGGMVALVLLGYSMKRFRYDSEPAQGSASQRSAEPRSHGSATPASSRSRPGSGRR